MKPESVQSSESWQGDLPRDWRFFASAGAIAVVALLLRVYRIGAEELWLDEALSFHMATMPHWLAPPLIENNSPPLYYLLLRGWMKFAGQSEASLRLLSAGFGTLFVVAAIWAGREILDARVGLWSGAFSAVAPIHIYYSQEARSYALLTLALAAAYATLWRALRTNLWHWWALFSACVLAALYSHYFALLGLVPSAFLVWFWPEEGRLKQRWLRYGAAVLVAGLLFSPWLLLSFVFASHSVPDWIQRAWGRAPALLAIPKSLEVLGLGGQAGLLPVVLKQFTRLEFPIALRLLGIVVLLSLATWVAIPWGDRELGVPELGRRKAFLGLLLFFPLVVLWLVSFYRPVYVAGRYDLVAFPAYSLLLGLALAKVQSVRKKGPLLALLVALLLLIPIGAKLFLYYHVPSARDHETTAEFLHASVENGDLVVFTGPRGPLTLYYLSRLGYRWEVGSCRLEIAARHFSCRMVPRKYERRLSSLSAYEASEASDSGEALRASVQQFVRALPGRSGGLWVVFGGNTALTKRGLRLSRDDGLLVKELAQLGLRPMPVRAALGIFQFQRS